MPASSCSGLLCHIHVLPPQPAHTLSHPCCHRLQSLNCPEAVIATLSLAVEWLLQAPQEARQGAMLRATELLLAFLLCPTASGHASSGGGGLLEGAPSAAVAGGAAADGAPSTPLVSPAASGQSFGQHRLAGHTPTPLQLPPSTANSPEITTSSASPALSSLMHRPLSPNMAALQAAAAAASSGGTAAAAAAQQQQRRPSTPRASSFEQGDTSAADVLNAAAHEGGGGAAADAAAEAAAAEAAEAQSTLLWTFLNGHALVPQASVLRGWLASVGQHGAVQ